MLQANISSKLNSSQKTLSKVDANPKSSIKPTNLKGGEMNSSQNSTIKVLIDQAYKSKSNNSKSVTKSNHSVSSTLGKQSPCTSFNRNLKLEKALVPIAVVVNVNSTKSDKQPESKRLDKPQPDVRKSVDSGGNYDKLLLSNKGAESKIVNSQTDRKKSIAGTSNSVDFSQTKNQAPVNRTPIKIGSPKPEITIKIASPKINYNDINKEFSESGTYFPKHQQELQTIDQNCNIVEEIEIRGNCGSSPNLNFRSIKQNAVRPSIMIGSNQNSTKVRDSPTAASKQITQILCSDQPVMMQSQPSLFNFNEIDFLIDKIQKLKSPTIELPINSPQTRRKIFNKEHIAELYLFYYSRSKMNIKELLNLISIDPYSFAADDLKMKITSEIKNDSEKRVGKYRECLQYINYALSEVSNMIQEKEIESECNDQYEDTSHLVLCSETISSPKAENTDDLASDQEKSKKQQKRSWYDCCTNNVLGELEIIREEMDESKFTSKGASRIDSNESESKKNEHANSLSDSFFVLDLAKGNSSLKFNNTDSLNTDTIVHIPSQPEYSEYGSKEIKLQTSINSISSTLDTPQSNCHTINFKSKTAQASLNLRSLETPDNGNRANAFSSH